MSDAPVPSPTATIEKDITWVRTHLLISILGIALIAGIIIGGISLFEGLIERHDARIAAQEQKQLGIDTAAQAALVAQLSQYRASDAARDAAQTALIQSLVSQMAQQRAATAKQVTTDAGLDAQSAAARLVVQTKASPGDVTVSNDAVTMTLPLARTVVADLDLFSQSQNDVTNLQGQIEAQKILTSDTKVELSIADQVIVADKTELISTIKSDEASCKVRIDEQASKDRKRGFWAALGSFVGGMFLGSRL